MIKGFIVETEKSSKTKIFDITSNPLDLVSVAVFNRNRTEIFDFRTGLFEIISTVERFYKQIFLLFFAMVMKIKFLDTYITHFYANIEM